MKDKRNYNLIRFNKKKLYLQESIEISKLKAANHIQEKKMYKNDREE